MPVTMSGTMSSARMASPKTPKSPVNHAPVESDSQRLQRTLGQSGQWYGMYNPNGMKQTDSPTEFSQLESKARAAWDDKFEKTSGSGESGLFDYGMFASMDQRAGINGGWSTATQGAGSLEQQLGPVGARIARENMRQLGDQRRWQAGVAPKHRSVLCIGQRSHRASRSPHHRR